MSSVLVVSPHLDDAVLSIGGSMWTWSRAGHRVLVATVFTADEPVEPPSAVAEHLHRLWGGAGAMARRRTEDRAAAEHLGIEVIHLELEDALHRLDTQGRALYTTLGALFRSPVASDLSVSDRVAQALADLGKADLWLAPLGLGDHVDHLHARRGSELAGAGRRQRLVYYEEFPYAEKRFAGWRRRRGLTSRSLELSAEAVAARIEAICAYESQIAPLFGGVTELERRVRAYTRRVGGERFWHPKSAPDKDVMP